MGKQLQIYRRHGLEFGGGLTVSNVEHRSILAAVERGDCDAAGNEVEKHIENGRDRFIRAMSATGQLVLKENVTGPSSRRRRRGLDEDQEYRVSPGASRVAQEFHLRPVETDAGIDGWGEAYANTIATPRSPRRSKRSAATVGRDPFDIRHFTQIAFDDYAQRRGS